MDKHRAWATGDLSLTLSMSTHMQKAEGRGPSGSVVSFQAPTHAHPPLLGRMHRAGNQERSPGSTGHSWSLFPGQDGQVGGRLFNWMTATTWKSKMLPSPLKYSRCPSKDVKTLHKPPINFYGGLRSRLRIITFIFTRQVTKTTGEGGEAPGQCSLSQRSRLTASFSLHLRPTERELVAS